jgi:hypothetical protein
VVFESVGLYNLPLGPLKKDGPVSRSRLFAAILMLVSSFTHLVQLFVYPVESILVSGLIVFFTFAYFLIGIFLLGQSRPVLWVGSVIPAIAGVLASIRLATTTVNPLVYFHLAVDVVVVLICIGLLRRDSNLGRREPDA